MQVEVRRVGVGLAGQLEQTPFFVSPNPYYCYRPLLILPETRQDKHESRERTSSQNPKIWLNSILIPILPLLFVLRRLLIKEATLP